MTSHFSEHHLFQFYNLYQKQKKKRKNGYETTNLALVTKILKNCICTTIPFIALKYKHYMVKIKQIRENFEFS